MYKLLGRILVLWVWPAVTNTLNPKQPSWTCWKLTKYRETSCTPCGPCCHFWSHPSNWIAATCLLADAESSALTCDLCRLPTASAAGRLSLCSLLMHWDGQVGGRGKRKKSFGIACGFFPGVYPLPWQRGTLWLQGLGRKGKKIGTVSCISWFPSGNKVSTDQGFPQDRPPKTCQHSCLLLRRHVLLLAFLPRMSSPSCPTAEFTPL